MAFPFSKLFNRGKGRVSTNPYGVTGSVAYLGETYDDIGERDSKLIGERKYETYINMLANVSVVAASVRYFLNLTARANWTFTPAPADTDEKYAKLATEMLLKDPLTSWHRIVRRMALYRFYGFSLQEFTIRRRDDGILTIDNIANRPQYTIKEWNYDATRQNIIGVEQEAPVTGERLRIPMIRLLYLVDDTISDAPSGMGLLRHIVSATEALKRFEQLEGIGFESDLRGIPIGRAPLTRLREMVKSGAITEDQRIKIEAPLREFLKNHVKTPELGLLLDSHPYHAADEANRPSTQKQWDMELLHNTSTSLEALARAIQRLNREIARVLGTEQLMLGEDIAGSFALSMDKTQSFILLVEGALKEMRDAVKRDLLYVLWLLNGYPMEMMPEPKTEAVAYQNVKDIAEALNKLALAGVPVAPDDPALNQIRDLMGLNHTPEEIVSRLIESIANEPSAGDGRPSSGGRPQYQNPSAE